MNDEEERPEDPRRVSSPRADDIYDRVPYDAHPLPLTHPSRLAAAAALRGVPWVPPSRCRLLELGCADASNLLPMALAYPDGRFVGVDRSKAQLARGQADADALGLRNLELVCADIDDLGADLGSFDYLVAHGVYSWVSDATRERVLDLYGRALSEDGVGYLSYNTQPGWGIRGPIRELLRAHTRDVADPHAKIARARAHIERLRALGVGSEHDPYAALLAQILEPLASRSDSYLLHEYLTANNRAFSFVEVTDALATRGLEVFDDLIRATLELAGQEALEGALRHAELPPAEVEAAVDLLTGRQLRASLVRRSGRAPRPATERPLPRLEARLAIRPTPRALAAVHAGNRGPIVDAALSRLIDAWPASVGLEPLLRDPRRSDASADVDAARAHLLRLRALGYLEICVEPPRVVARPGARPEVTRLTQLDAARGRRVTNQLHASVSLEPDVAAVVERLDGTRDPDAIAAELPAGTAEAPIGLEDRRRRVAAALDVLVSQALLIA